MSSPALLSDPRAPRVAIVDDDAEMRALLRLLLRPLTADVVEIGSRGELLELLLNPTCGAGPDRSHRTCDHGVDLVIADVGRPAPGALAVLAHARVAGVAVPFVVVTAFRDDAVRAAVERFADARVLAKPFGRHDLIGLVTSMLAARGLDAAG